MRKTMLLGDTKFTNRDRAKLGKRERRIGNLLNSFKKEGGYHVELGLFYPSYKWDRHVKEHDIVNCGERFGLIIRDGQIIYSDPCSILTKILDSAGVKDSLPVFDGKELDYYTLSDDSTEWRKANNEKDGYFYLTHYSID